MADGQQKQKAAEIKNTSELLQLASHNKTFKLLKRQLVMIHFVKLWWMLMAQQLLLVLLLAVAKHHCLPCGTPSSQSTCFPIDAAAQSPVAPLAWYLPQLATPDQASGYSSMIFPSSSFSS